MSAALHVNRACRRALPVPAPPKSSASPTPPVDKGLHRMSRSYRIWFSKFETVPRPACPPCQCHSRAGWRHPLLPVARKTLAPSLTDLTDHLPLVLEHNELRHGGH